MEQERAGLAALSSLGDPVRSQLYEFVAGSAGPVGRDEAAAATGIGRPLAAYHLDKLAELGLLTASFRPPPGPSGRGAGRPAKVYARSGREFAATVPPREYELAASLLAQAIESDSGGQARAALHSAARRRGAELGRQHRAGPGWPGRARGVQATEAALRAHGFEPRLDQDGRIVLHNCPFHQLAIRNRDLICGMNLALVQGFAAGLGATGLSPALDPGPGRCCVVISQGQPA